MALVLRDSLWSYNRVAVLAARYNAIPPVAANRYNGGIWEQTRRNSTLEAPLSKNPVALSPPPLSVLPVGMLVRSLLIAAISSNRLLLLPSLSILSFLSNPGRGFLLNVDKNPFLHAILKRTFYNQFCAGENETETKATIQQLKDLGFRGIILTYALETVFDHVTNTEHTQGTAISSTEKGSASTYKIKHCPDIDAWRKGTLETIDLIDEGDYLALKLSGAGPTATVPFSLGELPSQQMMDALDEICTRSKNRKIRILVDAESQRFQRGIARVTLELMRKYNRDGAALIYNTYQAYLKGTPDLLQEHLEAASQDDFTLGLKLVRGAYIASDERSLIHDTKQDTDNAYNTIAQGALTKRQEAFNSAVQLLLDVFSPRGQSRIIDKDWHKGDIYITQVLALLENFRASQKEAEPLIPTADLMNLALYLDHNDTANNIGTVIDTGFMAWNSWSAPDKDQMLYATLLGYGGVQDMWIGEYHLAQRHCQEALKITLQHLAPDDEEVLNCYNNLGLVYGCQGDYVRGDNFLSRAEDISKANPAKYPAKGILINANTARNDYCNKRFEDAQRRLDLALSEAVEMQSWYWMACSLFCRNNNLPQADTHLQNAAEAIEQSGRGRDIKMNNYFAYQLGRLRLAQGRYDESVDQLQKAVKLDDVMKSPRGYRARNLYALSRAMLSNHQLEDTQKMKMLALELAGEKVAINGDPDDWFVYDLLVRIVERSILYEFDSRLSINCLFSNDAFDLLPSALKADLGCNDEPTHQITV
ncbi:hypothetical protein F5884DRAFT_752454 [Xylogone sp. PMI_703]|nr:hypothetical protein F5884DRAFT_752454 [Xylogone sp. PMI_703]